MKKYTINHQNLFSPEEDDFIRQHYSSMSDKEMADILGHTVSSVKQRRVCTLMLVRPMVKDHANTIRKMAWDGYTVNEIAQTIGFTSSAVSYYCKNNGIHPPRKSTHPQKE